MATLSQVLFGVVEAVEGIAQFSLFTSLSGVFPPNIVAITAAVGPPVLVGMALAGDADDPIEQLTAKVRRAIESDEPVDFTTTRDDELGALSRAIGELVAASDASERNDRYRRRLYEIAAEPGVDDATKVDRMLKLGCERLDVETALVTQIDADSDRYEVEWATENDIASVGSVTELSKTFCCRTITSDEALGIYDAVETGDADDPGYSECGIRCYLGLKLLVEDELYGTLCFVDRSARERPFSRAEKAFVDLLGRWISHVLERRERIETLERHSSILDSLFEQLPVSLYVKDTEGRHVRKSSSDLMEGYPDDEEWFLGKTDLEIYDEEHARETHADDMAVVETGEPILRKTEYDPATDDWIVTSKVPWRGADGEIRGLVGVTQYITEQREYERRLEALVENTTNQIFIKDCDGVYQFVNEAQSDLFGLSPEDVVGKRDEELFDPESIERFRADDRRVVEEGDTVTAEVTPTIDGEERVFLDNKYPYRDENGEIVGVMGISRDITERKKRQRTLRERERELSTLIANVPGMVYRCANEPDWPFEFVSEGCRELTGYEPSAIVDGDVVWSEDVIDDDNEALWETVQRALDDRERFQVTYQIETADGERRWLWEQGSGVYDDDGRVEALEGVILDITERKEHERRLERTTDLLSRAEQMADIGGWSRTVVDGEPAETEWTAKLYDIFELPYGEKLSVQEVLDYYHPDDRERHREAIERAIEMGVGWDQELRLTTATGAERWIRTIGEPVLEDDEAVEIRGSIQDITEQKERELALESLHDTTCELLTTESITGATELVVDTAASILDCSAVGIFLYDETANHLAPAALSDGFEDYCVDGPGPIEPDTESFVWHAYVTGTLSVVDRRDAPATTALFTDDVATRITVPIGSHGVFVALDETGPVADPDRHLAETLVATAEAALDRIESERELRDRDAEIATQNERLRRQVRITETIRSVDRSLVGATSRAELENDVCERLVEGEDVAFAWIGGFESGDDILTVRAWAGEEQGYLDAVSLDRRDETHEPAADVPIDGESRVVSTIARDVQREPWRQAALAADFQSMLAVPITLDEYSYGVLAVYADDADAFGDLETTVFTELGESIANALESITTRQALHSDTVISLSLRVEASRDLLATLSAQTGCRIEYEGVATAASEQDRLFVRTSGCALSSVRALLDDRHVVEQYQVVNEGENEAVVELTVREETIVSKLHQHGGRPRRVVAEDGQLSVDVDVPVSTDVRTFVEMLGDDATVELKSRQTRTRSLRSHRDFVDTVLDHLTERQREVLRSAYFSGFFNWPRDTTGAELAEMLGISQPTVNRHLRLAEQQIMRRLFDGADDD